MVSFALQMTSGLEQVAALQQGSALEQVIVLQQGSGLEQVTALHFKLDLQNAFNLQLANHYCPQS